MHAALNLFPARVSGALDMLDSIQREEAVVALRIALTNAIKDDFASALAIDRYAETLPDWRPKPNHCHEQVALWCGLHPGDKPVRGWVLDGDLLVAYHFVAHSLVRTVDGELLDVAFPTPDRSQTFIEHPATAGDFLALVQGEPPLPSIDVELPAGFGHLEIGADETGDGDDTYGEDDMLTGEESEGQFTILDGEG
jgi:hypothetical protein